MVRFFRRPRFLDNKLDVSLTSCCVQDKQAVEVTWEDQRNINSFGRINSDFLVVNAVIADYKVSHSGVLLMQSARLETPQVWCAQRLGVELSVRPCVSGTAGGPNTRLD